MRRHTILVLSSVIALSASCMSQQGADESTVDLFQPREYGTYEEPDGGDTRDTSDAGAIPEARIEPASNYPWLPQDRPIRFHTREESEATSNTWKPLYDKIGQPDSALIAHPVGVQYKYARDRNLAHLAPTVPPDERFRNSHPYVGPGQRHIRGRFVGLGEPFKDEHLHMFEIGGIYLVGSYLVRAMVAGVTVRFLSAENSPADPEELEAGRQLRLPPELWSWFEQVSLQLNGGDFSGERLDVYFYFTQTKMHATTQRNISWKHGFSDGMADDFWYFSSSIPDEFEVRLHE